ncbi:hypothetical protein GO308_14160 [Sphingomonas sp. SFZ2018-12]|uniref:glycosyltransferase family 25 protein n=1 Tax=Sphingomonas sp. SFZ2018-12 TaxID=2683197 RepID=UPI001F0E2F02|nr:glycosyltransferase family 25 protein [Sphingomonas sp. SFZ2018-12]MCH4894264.1 hypothetical protein [Sphingomonas sp. SFZ2018-12]
MPDPVGLTGIDHGFCINLDRRPDRWAAFRARLPATLNGVIERRPAVDGRELSMTAEIRALFAHNDFQFRRNILGCSLSHLGLWRLLAGRDYPYDRTAVFEDDAWFSSRFTTLWNERIAKHIPVDFDLIYLGGLLGPATIREMDELMQKHDGHLFTAPELYLERRLNEALVMPKQSQFCTYSYVISRRGAEKLCQMVERDGFERSIDWFMIDRWPEMNVYATDPLLCWSVFQEGSDILFDFDVLADTAKADGDA